MYLLLKIIASCSFLMQTPTAKMHSPTTTTRRFNCKISILSFRLFCILVVALGGFSLFSLLRQNRVYYGPIKKIAADHRGEFLKLRIEFIIANGYKTGY